MNQSNATNVLQLQSALRSLEDRCQKLQRRADSLQSENERLLSGRSELLAEVERLQEQQIRLRERNLRLTQEFHSKQQECSFLTEKLTMFVRGRVGDRSNGLDSFKSVLTEVKEDTEGSVDSLETVELQGERSTRTKILIPTKRTLSEPNLSVIQRELDQVRKGLWSNSSSDKSPTIEELSSRIILNLKRGQSELEEQFSKMVEIQRNSLEVVHELSGVTTESEFEVDQGPVEQIEHCTQNIKSLKDNLKSQNETLKRIFQLLNNTQDVQAASVVTQTSFCMPSSDSMNSTVWKNMKADRICPLCETVFPVIIPQEEFEDHVMEHFNAEECPEFEIL